MRRTRACITPMKSPIARLARHVVLITAIYSLACIPTILLSERYGWTQAPYHLTQLIAIILCLISSIVFLAATRSSPFGPWQWLASSALALCALWLAFVAYVLLTYSGPGD